MTSVPQNMNSMNDSGAKPTVQPSTAPKNSSNTTGATGGSEAYPEQKHAGKVGLGPNYHTGATLEDRVKGLKEELKGKITHKPELVEHGRELKSGEERRKKLAGEDEPNPFQNADEDKKKDNAGDQTHNTDDKPHLPSGPIPHEDGKQRTNPSTGQSGTVDTHPQSQSHSQSRQTDPSTHNLPHSNVPVSDHDPSQRGGQNTTNNPFTSSAQDQFPGGQTDNQTSMGGNHDQFSPQAQSQIKDSAARQGFDYNTVTSSNQSQFQGGGQTDHQTSLGPGYGQFSPNSQSQIKGSAARQGIDFNPSVNSTQNQFSGGQTDHQMGARHVEFPPTAQSQIKDSGARQGIDFDPASFGRTSDQEKPSSRFFESESDAGPNIGNSQVKTNPLGMAVGGGYGKGAMEQAATVAPEGTHAADKQRRGNNVDFMADAPRSRQ